MDNIFRKRAEVKKLTDKLNKEWIDWVEILLGPGKFDKNRSAKEQLEEKLLLFEKRILELLKKNRQLEKKLRQFDDNVKEVKEQRNETC